MDENANFDSAKIWHFDVFQNLGCGKMRNRDIKTWNSISILSNSGSGNSKSIPKTKKSSTQILKFDFGFEFWGQTFDFKNYKIRKSFSSIPFEFRFETPQFEIAVVENPEILIFDSKFKFFFDQNLDFVLGTVGQCCGWRNMWRTKFVGTKSHQHRINFD